MVSGRGCGRRVGALQVVVDIVNIVTYIILIDVMVRIVMMLDL